MFHTGAAVRESAATKARRYLAEGRVIIVDVRPDKVAAIVRGDGAHYSAGYAFGQWKCDCPAVSHSCAHLLALRLTTAPDIDDPRGQDRRIRRCP